MTGGASAQEQAPAATVEDLAQGIARALGDMAGERNREEAAARRPVYIRNNDVKVRVVSDLKGDGGAEGRAWYGCLDPDEPNVRIVTQAELETSIGLKLWLETPLPSDPGKMVFEVMPDAEAMEMLKEKSAGLRDGEEYQVELMNAPGGELVRIYCMGHAESGVACQEVVEVALDGKDVPLCGAHRGQEDELTYLPKHRIWLGMRFADLAGNPGSVDESLDMSEVQEVATGDAAPVVDHGVPTARGRLAP